MPELPRGSEGAVLHRASKENQDPTASITPQENRPIKIEPGTPIAVVHEETSAGDCSTNLGAPVDPEPFEPRLSAEQVLEVAHSLTKATLRLKDKVDSTIQASKARISTLEKMELRLKSRLEEEKERLKDANTDFQAALHYISIMEERLDNELLVRRDIEMELARYRGWWLNEYYSLKVALGMIADPDDGVVAMRESSHARYCLYLASQSDSA